MRREMRLRRRAEFEDTRIRGRRVSDGLLIMGAAPGGQPVTRFGLAVSKRVGGAVVRNRLKRRLRACLSTLDVRPGYNVVVSARPAAANVPYARLRESVEALAKRARVLRSGGEARGAQARVRTARRPGEGRPEE